MPEVAAAALVPGPGEDVLALWDDPGRWASFVDGFRAVVRVDAGWPAPGCALTWTTGPHGVGRTRETARAPGVREVENDRLKGTMTAAWADGELTVSLVYELKQRTPATLFFVRRSLRDSLRRTVSRLAIERISDLEVR